MTIISSISAALESVRLHHPGSNLTAATTLAVVLGSSYLILFGLLEVHRPRGFRRIPTISPWIPLLIIAKVPFQDRYNRLMRAVQEKHGLSRLNIFGRQTVYISSPEYARQLLMDTDTFPKVNFLGSRSRTLLARFFGVNVVFSNGHVWRRHRMICNPAFHRSWPTDIFGERSRAMIDSIEKTGLDDVDVLSYFQRLTLDALGKIVFDYDFNSIEDPQGEYVSKYNHIMNHAFHALYFLFPWLDTVPGFRRSQLFKSVDDFDDLMFKLIEKKREELRQAEANDDDNKNANDLLSLMVKANEDGESLTNEELRANLVIFFVAGHETTASALSCAMYEIARSPDIQDQLHAEVTSILGPSTEANSNPVPTLEESKRMSYVNAVIKENLRMYSPINLLPQRVVSQDTPVGPYIIPSKTEIILNVHSIHHNPKYWENPDEFRPERFNDVAADIEAEGGIIVGKKDPFSWLPFSYGSRNCIGMNFSLVEQRVVLSMLVHRFKFSLIEGSKHKDGIKFVPRGLMKTDDLRIKFTPRY